MYMSPKSFKSYCRGVTKVKHNKHKSDAFSLGLTILEAGLLKPIQNIYNKSKGKINQGVLRELLSEFSNRYIGDYDLVQAVRSMLVVSEFDRSDFIELRDLYASNLSIKELTQSDPWADIEGGNDVVRTVLPGTQYYNNQPGGLNVPGQGRQLPLNQLSPQNQYSSRLWTNRAHNPMAMRTAKYGADYMNFDEENQKEGYWSPNPHSDTYSKHEGDGSDEKLADPSMSKNTQPSNSYNNNPLAKGVFNRRGGPPAASGENSGPRVERMSQPTRGSNKKRPIMLKHQRTPGRFSPGGPGQPSFPPRRSQNRVPRVPTNNQGGIPNGYGKPVGVIQNPYPTAPTLMKPQNPLQQFGGFSNRKPNGGYTTIVKNGPGGNYPGALRFH